MNSYKFYSIKNKSNFYEKEKKQTKIPMPCKGPYSNKALHQIKHTVNFQPPGYTTSYIENPHFLFFSIRFCFSLNFQSRLVWSFDPDECNITVCISILYIYIHSIASHSRSHSYPIHPHSHLITPLCVCCKNLFGSIL